MEEDIIIIKKDIHYPNCDKLFDGMECNNCGFDAYCYDSNYD